MKTRGKVKWLETNILNLRIMKKLSKLLINPDRLMKNGELKTIKGGYDWEPVGCCFCYDHDLNVMGGMAAFNADDCMQNCHYAGDWIGFYIC